MAIKKVLFKNMVKASTYYALGGIRFYRVDGSLININFENKNLLLTNTFTGDVKGTVSTSNSYGSNYFIDNPFDTTKKQSGITYTNHAYWLSGSANEISITFDTPIEGLSKIDFNPTPDYGYTDRNLLRLTIEIIDESGNVIASSIVDTSNTANDTVQSLDVSVFFDTKRFLAKSNNKIYSFKSDEILYEPIMTSNTTPAPYVASASSTYNSSYLAWKAFNGTNKANTDCWLTEENTTRGWLQLDFGRNTKVNKVSITSRSSSEANQSSPKDFNIEGSNDGVNFYVIQSFINIGDWVSATTKDFKIKNSNYRFYRLNILANNGYANYTAVAKLEFEYNGADLIELPLLSIENFKNHGKSSPVFDNIFFTKNYILQDTVSEDADGRWKQEIDRKPLSIKFEQRK